MTVLIIEDDATQNNVLAGFLKKENLEVRQAFSVAEGWEQFDSKVKLIVLDLNLPDGTGLDYLQELRTKSNVPVIVLTALNDEYTQLNVFDLQADEYVDKPVSPLIMTKRIQALLKRVYPPSERLQILGFSFDFDQWQATNRHNEAIDLTATEFQIIKQLSENQTLTREALIEAIWGWEYRGEVRILDPHISNIRKKLAPEIIKTVKGIGYRLGDFR